MYCKAGFKHTDLKECEHIVPLPVAPRPKARSIVPDDYYSEEAMAARRAENKLKYLPTHRAFNRHRGQMVGNEATETLY